MSTTNYLGLNIPDKNSKGRVVTDVFEPNFTKIDQNAEKLKTEIDGKLDKGSYVGTAENLHADKNAIWGGEYGGYIQDTSVTKVVGKRYIDQFDKKAYECLVPSHENTITNYQACNVKDNLHKQIPKLHSPTEKTVSFMTGSKFCTITECGDILFVSVRFVNFKINKNYASGAIFESDIFSEFTYSKQAFIIDTSNMIEIELADYGINVSGTLGNGNEFRSLSLNFVTYRKK